MIKDIDFYKGEEPNFNVVTRGLDVVKTGYIEDFKVIIKDVLLKNTSTLIPIFFVSGDFGIGKSTTTLRLIYEFCKDPGENVVAFEVIDLMNTKKEMLLDLIHQVKSERVIFFIDDVEVESSFKGLLDLQRELSIEQIQQSEVVLIVPIRGNILEKFRLSRDILNCHLLNLDGRLTEGELSDLLEKLKNATLISFRDAAEKFQLMRKIQWEYNSDSFISLMATITSGRHENDLIHSYNQLSKDAQNAFLFTALLHKHKLLMPASLLKQNVSMSWDDFIIKIVKAEGKGLLIQEEKFSHGTQPDLYFRTKHPLIADRLVNKIIPNVDKQYKMYESMLRGIEPGVSNSYLVNALLKGFIKSREFNDLQINKLFDAGFTKLSDDPYFLLNYAINLQSRRTIYDLRKALDILIYAESLLEYRNHRFIHRRGVVSFELAKLYTETAKDSYMHMYLREAEDLLYTKQLMDPFSSYSYVDYIKMLLWEIKIMNYDKETIIQKIIKIEDLFEVSNRLVDDGLYRIHSLTTDYAECLKDISDNTEYKQFLQNLYEDFHLKPYACILLYNHYNYLGNQEAAERYINEMEYYKDNFEVVKFLFKYYGQRLYDANSRVKLLTLSRENPHLEQQNAFRYNFFNFIAESYNHQFSEGRRYLYSLQTKGYNINPEFHEIWFDPNGEEISFDAIIIKDKWARYKSVKIPIMQQQFKLLKGNYDSYVEGTRVNVKLHFYLYGIIAEIKGGKNS